MECLRDSFQCFNCNGIFTHFELIELFRFDFNES